MLGVSSGSVFAGIFGMNLTSHLEEHPFAFYASAVSIILLSLGIIASLMICLRTIESNTSEKKNYLVLRNFMSYIDSIIGKLKSSESKSLMAPEFEAFLKNLVGEEKGISDVSEETQLLFGIFDKEHSGKKLSPET